MAVVVKLTVTTPQGIAGGDLVRVAAPDGSYHSIMVPGGLTSGQQFSVELLAVGSATGAASAAELQRLRMELDAERALRRETQQEALRSRTALEALQMKRAQDHAFFRESVKVSQEVPRPRAAALCCFRENNLPLLPPRCEIPTNALALLCLIPQRQRRVME